MYRVHRLGHIEAKSVELSMPASAVRMAQYGHMYLTLGFEAEIEKEVGISIEGADRVRVMLNPETLERRVLIESDPRR